MALNLLKKYNDLLDLAFLSEKERIASLTGIFNRDITNNPHFFFQNKPIYPTPRDYLLTAYHLEGKDDKRNKILAKYKKRKLPVVY